MKSSGILSLVVVCSCVHVVRSQRPNINHAAVLIRQGMVRGFPVVTQNRVIYAFLGIPYAMSPVGENRFRPPEPHRGWNFTLDANNFGPSCPQPDRTSLRLAEDCLTLNVWTPEVSRIAPGLPVLLIFLGDQFTYDDVSRYPGDDLAGKGVVVVTANYRLNLFGFLSTEDIVAAGNYGLLDQEMVIKWVGENIDRFGGDPSKVTLVGHSAGSAGVVYQALSPRMLGRGYFQNVIAMSGTVLAPWSVMVNPRIRSFDLGRRVDCPTDSSTRLMGCLRGKDMLQLLEALTDQMRESNIAEVYGIYGPSVDDFLPESAQILPRHPLHILHLSQFQKIPFVTGVTKMDGAAFLEHHRAMYQQGYQGIYNTFVSDIIPSIISDYGFKMNIGAIQEMLENSYVRKATPGNRNDLLMEMINIFSDAYFMSPGERFVKLLVTRGAPTYMYYFEYDVMGPFMELTSAGRRPKMDLIFLFGPAAYRIFFNREMLPQEIRLSDDIQSYFIDFSRISAPTFTDRWQRMTDVHTIQYFSLDRGLMELGPSRERMMMWNEVLPRLGGSLITTTTQNPTTTYATTTIDRQVEDTSSAYRAAVWVMVTLLLLLILGLIAGLIYYKKFKSRREKEFTVN